MRKGLRKFEPYHWVVEAVGHKLVTHQPVIEPFSAASGERNFAMQRQKVKSAFLPLQRLTQRRGRFGKSPLSAGQMHGSAAEFDT